MNALRSFVGVALLLVLPASVRADCGDNGEIYTQCPNGLNAEVSSSGWGTRAADSLVFDKSTVLTRVDWWGGYGLMIGNVTFETTVYENDAAAPGKPDMSTAVVVYTGTGDQSRTAFAFESPADVFNMPSAPTSLEPVIICDLGHAQGLPYEMPGYGAVNYRHIITKHEVTAAQYSALFNPASGNTLCTLFRNSRAKAVWTSAASDKRHDLIDLPVPSGGTAVIFATRCTD